MPRESYIEGYLIGKVVETGGITRKMQYIGRMGCPDRWCGWPSTKRTAWVELKGDGGRLSGHQVREIDRLRECGVTVRVMWSIEEVDAFIEEMTA